MTDHKLQEFVHSKGSLDTIQSAHKVHAWVIASNGMTIDHMARLCARSQSQSLECITQLYLQLPVNTFYGSLYEVEGFTLAKY